jgi:uncharacterized protein (DUF302 family)
MAPRLLLAVFLACVGLSVSAVENNDAGKIYSARLEQPFADAINSLQLAIQDAGYKVLRIQRVDYGLHAAGYAAEPYRIVFYGRQDVADTIARRPDLTVFLPLAITIYADHDKTGIVAASPLGIGAGTDAGIRNSAMQWDRDMQAIIAKLLSGEAE